MNILHKILEEIENINYYPEGMGCGIEDCGITDRYEACEYGWNQAIEAVIESIQNINGVTDINVDKIQAISKEMEEYLFEKYCIEGDHKIEKIIQSQIDDATDTGWIPVENGLPEEGETVIITDKNGSVIYDVEYYREGGEKTPGFHKSDEED